MQDEIQPDEISWRIGISSVKIPLCGTEFYRGKSASKIGERIEPTPKFHRQHKILPLKISRGKFCSIKFRSKSRV
ncbi:hypothetical protein [uncultured Campylobacter sp.]|uniref:hypothetical protein n=1 Tax=uncultured Campylobacter sp. TaxID=218934 RepID=UPI0026332830|nr:hypothetical protein [uncultured Campylobacter sp.]